MAIMKKSFKVGDRVAYLKEVIDNNNKVYYDKYSELFFGNITKIVNDNLTIQCDQGTKYCFPKQSLTVVDLETETNIKIQYSALEDEYNSLENKIKNKLDAAAILLSEANQLAQDNGKSLQSFNNANSSLFNTMDNCGWRTSSFGC
jgi:hypothetical protein